MGYDPPVMVGPASGGDGGAGATGPAGATGATGPGGAGGGLSVYGDGHHGDVVYSEDTELSETIYADDLTVEAGVSLDLNEWPIYVRGTLTIGVGATIHNDAGVDPIVDFYGALLPGYNGEPTNSLNGPGVNSLAWYFGQGVGGDGGSAGLQAGGIALPPEERGLLLQRSSFGGGTVGTKIAWTGSPEDRMSFRAPYAGGGGGASGGGAGGVGGFGGNGGGPVVIVARHIVNNGTIRTAGQDGEDGSISGVDDWTAAQPYNAGDRILPTTHVYRASGSGTADVLPPVWTDDGSDVIDNDITWIDLGVQGGGGGGGGQGGVIVAVFDSYTGPALTAATNCPPGAGGVGDGSGADGDDGDVGVLVLIPNV